MKLLYVFKKRASCWLHGMAGEKLDDNQWTLLYSEPLSQQRWQQSPPIANS